MRHNNYRPDEYDLERSHELERLLDRNEEREPYWMHRSKPTCRSRPRYFAGMMFRAIPALNPVVEDGIAELFEAQTRAAS